MKHPQVAPGLCHVVGGTLTLAGKEDGRVVDQTAKSVGHGGIRKDRSSKGGHALRRRQVGRDHAPNVMLVAFSQACEEGLGFLGGGPHVHEGSPSRFDQRGHGGCAQAAASSSDENGLRAHAPRWTLRT